eukprot:2531680-Prymnesium_polylepis.2
MCGRFLEATTLRSDATTSPWCDTSLMFAGRYFSTHGRAAMALVVWAATSRARPKAQIPVGRVSSLTVLVADGRWPMADVVAKG